MAESVPTSPSFPLIKVAIADDHARFRVGIRAVLALHTDIDLMVEAENGRELLDLIVNTIPDVILLDIQMPVMDGIAALPLIREKYPQVKVIILSMHNDAGMTRHLMERGADAYLPKNSDVHIIYETIQACYSQQRRIA
ncbi:MAG: response regulator transcription factor [Chitinophagaceae bacterium]|nr:response regulator transcription factor [Chitinophagaceae bacterium]